MLRNEGEKGKLTSVNSAELKVKGEEACVCVCVEIELDLITFTYSRDSGF